MKRNLITVGIALAALTLPAQAANIVDEWPGVKAPAAPELKAVTVDPKTTALLMLDFMNQNCGKRPRCLDTIPAMKKLLADARANKVPVIYSIIANSTPEDVIKDVAPQADEPHVLSGPDKFRNTDLEKILKDKGITTVIAVGTASNGAVLYTASGAAFRGMSVIIPVDGMSARRSLCGVLDGFHIHECPDRLGKNNAHQERHDQVLTLVRPFQARGGSYQA
jgi:isochorismate hydrolase